MQRIYRSGFDHATFSMDVAWRPGTSLEQLVSEAKKSPKLYGLQPWIVRNLLNFKNCLMKCSYFKDNEKVFKKVFGARNITITPNEKKLCIISITDAGVAKAKALIY